MSLPPAERERGVRWAVSALGVVAIALAGVFPVANADAFGHLAQGRQIFELGHVPKLDRFSIATEVPQPWHNYEWLSDLASYAIYRALGADGMIAVKCALLALFALLAYAVSRCVVRACDGNERALSRATAVCACWLIWVIPAARFRLTERPHLVALPFVALLLLGLLRLCERDTTRALSRKDRMRWLLLLFASHALWVNLHGSHLLGLATTLCFLAAATLRTRDRKLLPSLLAVLGLQAVASCLSPYGPAIVLDAIEHVVDPRYRDLVTEWRPWQSDDPTWLLVAPLLHPLSLVWAVRKHAPSGFIGRALALFALLLCVAWARAIRFTA
jgi:hypothetical protein